MDPLAQLQDIHLPEQVHQYPLAYGWWILLLIIIMAIVVSIKKYFNYRKRCHAQKLATKNIVNNSLDTDQILATLKWAAIQYFPRQNIAKLTGEPLLQFFCQCLPIKHQNQFTGLIQTTFEQRYQAKESNNTDELKEAALLWLKCSLPPKQETIDLVLSDSKNKIMLKGANT